MAHYDLLVIGTGPAGQKAAVQAAKLSKKVGIVERAPGRFVLLFLVEWVVMTLRPCDQAHSFVATHEATGPPIPLAVSLASS